MTLVAAAYHESGHAIATLWAFRRVTPLPNPRPRSPVAYVEIANDSGNCYSTDIYCCAWSEDRLTVTNRAAMEAQVIIELSGGIAEALHRGEWRKRAILGYSQRHCQCDTDLTKARAVLGDLRRLDHRYDMQDFAERTLTLMVANWQAVTALASPLVEQRRIDGERVEAIIDGAMIGSTFGCGARGG